MPEENTSGKEGRITFTLAGALAGARSCVPIVIGGFGIGLVFGTLAGQAGLGATEADLMSALVFSGRHSLLCLGSGLLRCRLPPSSSLRSSLVSGTC
jgi:predicted branched-subunit amino acid permease